jgi:hypothetical protein
MRTEHGSSEVAVEDSKTSTEVLSGAAATVYVAPDLRIFDDSIQWIVQRHIGSRWKDQSYHRSRRVLIERLGVTTFELEALPEFHSEPRTPDWPRCTTCGRWKCLPRNCLPRHLFCIARDTA